MRFTINANLRANGFLGETVNWPMSCKLSVAEQEHMLIQFNLAEDELDLLKMINQLFGSSLTEGIFTVSSAGFVMLIRLSDQAAEKELGKVFPGLSLPFVVQHMKSQRKPALCLWCTLHLKNISIFDHLLEIGYDTREHSDELSMIACISEQNLKQRDVKNVVFEADFPNIRLFQMLELKNVVMKYRAGEEKYFYLHGIISLTVFDQTYNFEGELATEETKSHAAMIITKGKSDIPQLFDGEMSGISFDEGIMLYIEHTYENPKEKTQKVKTTIYIGGKVPIGEAKLMGCVYLIDKKPELVTVSLDKNGGSLSISALMEQCLPSFPWPKEYLDLTIYEGSQLYYLSENYTGILTDERGIPYKNGFHAYVKMCLKLFRDFPMTGMLSVMKNGVEASLILTEQEIDLFLLQLEAAENETGIVVSFSSMEGKKYFQIKCKVKIFHKEIGDIVIGCGKYTPAGKTESEMLLTAEFDVTNLFQNIFGNYLPVGKSVKLGLKYSKTMGVELLDWPQMDLLDKARELLKGIEKFINNTNKASCSMVWDVLTESSMQVTFEVTPNMAQKNEQYIFELNVKMVFHIAKIKITDKEYEGVLEVPLSSEITFDMLPQMILNAITTSISNIIQIVIHDTDTIALIVSAVAGKQAMAYGLSLLCKKLITGAEAKAIGKAGETLANEFIAAGIGVAGESIADMWLKVAGGVVGTGLVTDIIRKTSKSYKDTKEKEKEEEEKDPEKEMEPQKPSITYVGYGQTWIGIGWNRTKHTTFYKLNVNNPYGEQLIQQLISSSEGEKHSKENVDFLQIIDMTHINVYEYYEVILNAYNDKKSSKSSRFLMHKLIPPRLEINQLSDLRYQIVVCDEQENVSAYEITWYVNSQERNKFIIYDKEYLISNAEIEEYYGTELCVSIRAIHNLPQLSSEQSERTQLPISYMNYIMKWIDTYGEELTMEKVATNSYERYETFEDCYCNLKRDFPLASMTEIARYIVSAGYELCDIASILRIQYSEWKNLSDAEIYSMVLLFSEETALSMNDMIYYAREHGMTEEECLEWIKESYPEEGKEHIMSNIIKEFQK